MKSFPIAFALLLFTATVSAQSDSAWFDMGRIRLNKAFTQATTIRTSDIARIPFLNLSEVIRSWANGALTQKDQIVYVVDGITVVDIDVYNIQDIEDITIIRNALGNQSGVDNLQLMALVRTKQWSPESRHIRFSAMGSALHRRVTSNISRYQQQTENVFSGNFQQYALSVSGGNQKINYGGSLGFVHDEMPPRNRKDSLYDKRVPGINRLKIYLWGSYAINKNNTLSAHFNYTPQTERSHMYQILERMNIDDTKKDREYVINPYIKLETSVRNFFANKFSFSYLNGRVLDSGHVRWSENSGAHIRNGWSVDSVTAETFIFNDNLSFIVGKEKWQLEPSVNINFQKAFFRKAGAISARHEQVPDMSYSWSMQRRYAKLLTATPSVSISYDAFFLLQLGVLLDGSKIIDTGYMHTRSYPFINGTVNLAKVFKTEQYFGWKVFGSSSERFTGVDGIYQLSDFNHNIFFSSIVDFSSSPTGAVYPAYVLPANKLATMWQTGSSLSFLQEKIRVSYNYTDAEQRQVTVIRLSPWVPFTEAVAGKYHRKKHYFSIEADIFRTDKLTWHSGLFANIIKNASAFDVDVSRDLLVFTEQASTGGWVNRLRYKKISAGADILFLLDHEERSVNDLGEFSVKKYNTLQLANLFFAYQLNIQRIDGELFITGRNLIDSATYPISPDRKKYFGAGFRVSL